MCAWNLKIHRFGRLLLDFLQNAHINQSLIKSRTNIIYILEDVFKCGTLTQPVPLPSPVFLQTPLNGTLPIWKFPKNHLSSRVCFHILELKTRFTLKVSTQQGKLANQTIISMNNCNRTRLEFISLSFLTHWLTAADHSKEWSDNLPFKHVHETPISYMLWSKAAKQNGINKSYSIAIPINNTGQLFKFHFQISQQHFIFAKINKCCLDKSAPKDRWNADYPFDGKSATVVELIPISNNKIWS